MENDKLNSIFSGIFDFDEYINEHSENLNETSTLAAETTKSTAMQLQQKQQHRQLQQKQSKHIQGLQETFRLGYSHQQSLQQ
ncbi:hypothetical protein DPMN_119246 [Dreissena polymorpha]|uniref:Uncharacterized protein n=1 Tax=Dreissena polymorpha TaxID=45954 RepID=A0A9D4GLN1_DREPO|nr:hypothetical protein DPMN_119246 [Dreissena polymorpha]